jgi:hypothetical protein
MKPVKMEKINGHFHTGDSYILLCTSLKRPGSAAALAHNIHFWLGEETSNDESGVAAYKTVELDDSLGGGMLSYCITSQSITFRKS